MVKAMPIIMAVLSVVGIAAMIWVGGQILWHGLETLGVAGPAHVIHAAAEGAAGALPGVHGLVSWVVTALCSAIVGLVVGGIIAAIVHAVKQRRAHP
jgi:predicted DNA repair protein MutK